MNIQSPFQDGALRQRLLDRLSRGLRSKPPESHNTKGAQIFTYCALTRERLEAITLPHPVVGIVLRGHKEVWFGNAAETLTPGTVFCAPRGVKMDFVNIPSPSEGIYESLIFEITTLPNSIATLPHAPQRAGVGPLQLRLTEDLIEAIAHAATAIVGAAARDDIKTLRLAEMLALMRDDPAARHIFTRSLADELAWRIAARPDHRWTVPQAAADLGLGGSTLRRRLARDGTSFREILKAARMQAAHRLIADGMSATAAADAAGYASRSHFARQYRATFGVLPSGRSTQNNAP
ncbi:MAG: helix-turn-helix domain-containing protein [Paracoccaceae bacterium]